MSFPYYRRILYLSKKENLSQAVHTNYDVWDLLAAGALVESSFKKKNGWIESSEGSNLLRILPPFSPFRRRR
jgi:hypothetical protein